MSHFILLQSHFLAATNKNTASGRFKSSSFVFLFSKLTMVYLHMPSFYSHCIGFSELFDMSFISFLKFPIIVFSNTVFALFSLSLSFFLKFQLHVSFSHCVLRYALLLIFHFFSLLCFTLNVFLLFHQFFLLLYLICTKPIH